MLLTQQIKFKEVLLKCKENLDVFLMLVSQPYLMLIRICRMMKMVERMKLISINRLKESDAYQLIFHRNNLRSIKILLIYAWQKVMITMRYLQSGNILASKNMINNQMIKNNKLQSNNKDSKNKKLMRFISRKGNLKFKCLE